MIQRLQCAKHRQLRSHEVWRGVVKLFVELNSFFLARSLPVIRIIESGLLGMMLLHEDFDSVVS